ncbi:hypothetical protein [Leptolyngbya sp. FACHB-16]|uniref:hypothetical protein n=1 Tax=unclassified Leptolyngbya TaxID=2650499 RepID=UPI001683D3D5|nr:hypothetical protein [Leptolyngbya sp. FACHB-16]MBD2156018.1 hypothetical protein [Leptolyngbya sp. FACHB-16]
MTHQNYEEWIASKGHLPTGILGIDFSTNSASDFLENKLTQNETLVDITGVRHHGKEAFLILTSRRLICTSLKPKFKTGSDFEVFFDFHLKLIERVLSAPSNGLIVETKNTKINIYYIQPSTGQLFSKSLLGLVNNIEVLETIPNDKYEKGLAIKGFAIFLVIVGLFGSCVHRSMSESEPATTNLDSKEVEACLRRYIQGDTVEANEVEEARRRCAP